MHRTVLLLLTCLLPALPTVAQAPEKAAPDDLVVTAEIVGYGRATFFETKDPSAVTLFVKMSVRNTTDRPRAIITRVCGWPSSSWLGNGPNGLFLPTIQLQCDRDFAKTITIPANGTLEFNCPLFLLKAHLSKTGRQETVDCFRLGFIDLKSELDAQFWLSDEIAIPSILHKARKICWSNTLTNEVNPADVKEVKGGIRDYYSWMTPNEGRY